MNISFWNEHVILTKFLITALWLDVIISTTFSAGSEIYGMQCFAKKSFISTLFFYQLGG